MSIDNSLLYFIDYPVVLKPNMEIKVKDNDNNYYNINGELSTVKIVFQK